MRKHTFQTGLISTLLLFVLISSSAFAQSGFKTFTSEDGSFSFIYPADWDISATREKAYLNNHEASLANPALAINVQINLPLPFSVYQQQGFGNTPYAIVQTILQTWRDAPPTRIDNDSSTLLTPIPTPPILATKATIEITEIPFNGRTMARGTFYDDKFGFEIAYLLLAVDIGEGYCVLIVVSTPPLKNQKAVISAYEPIIMAMAQSMNFQIARYIPPTATPNPYQVNPQRVVNWETWAGTLTFINAEGWYFVSTASGNFLQNIPDNLDGTQLHSGLFQAAITSPVSTRQNYLWKTLSSKGWHNDPSGDSQIINQLDCKAVTPEITTRKIIESYIPSSDQRAQLLQQGTQFGNVEEITLEDGRKVTFVRVSIPQADLIIFAIEMKQADIVTIAAAASKEELAQYEGKLLEVIRTLRYTRASGCQP